jgi:NTP pyrophosphatase (non-canonical NTP hydrolase)
MPLTDYQKQLDDWYKKVGISYWSPLSQFARLAEETGEVGRILNHKYGQKFKKPTEEPDDLEGELGDIIFNVLCLANTQNINLDKAVQKVIDKAKARDKDRLKLKA